MSRHTLNDFYWLIVTGDKYEIPLAVFDSLEELSAAMGTPPENIYSSIRMEESRRRRGLVKGINVNRPRCVRVLKEEYKKLE